jgi:predicted nucleic-acid-binding Zn-ribbon protein
MRDGTCPNCSGTEVYAARNGMHEHLVHIRPHLEPSFRGAVRPHPTQDLWQYVCVACGYVETYLHDGDALEFVRQRWMRVTPPPPPPA